MSEIYILNKIIFSQKNALPHFRQQDVIPTKENDKGN